MRTNKVSRESRLVVCSFTADRAWFLFLAVFVDIVFELFYRGLREKSFCLGHWIGLNSLGYYIRA